jgi:hypothetical protein
MIRHFRLFSVPMRNVLLLCAVFAIVSACSSLRSSREELKDTVTAYNDLLRWNEFNKAKNFVDDSVRKEFESSAQAAKNARIADYRILNADFEAQNGDQIVEVEFDYYVSPTYLVKTLLDKQKWSYIYVEKDKRKHWRLMTPMPDFK